MPLINIPVGIAPCQIDDFPKTVGKGEDAKPFERSCKGALYLRPASTKVVTQHELDHIKKHGDHKMLARRLVVVKVDVVTDQSDRSKAKVTDEQRARAEAKVKMREAGKAAPMMSKQAKRARAMARAEAKKPKQSAVKSEAPLTSGPAPSSESSGEGSGSRSKRRRGGGGS